MANQQNTPLFFTDAQLELMRSVLDRIIPSNAKLPGAGALGVADYIDRVVGESAALSRLFGRGLAQIEIGAQARHSASFADLTNEQKDDVLRGVEARETAFFDALVRQTYNGYYINPRVLALLGLEARPPQPRGHRVPAGDLNSLEIVKKRGQAYRSA